MTWWSSSYPTSWKDAKVIIKTNDFELTVQTFGRNKPTDQFTH